MTHLDERRKKYDIPQLPYLPLGKNVLIYRIEAEEKTAGGLIMPEIAKPIYSRGVLVGAGLAARDILADGLIEIGDEVCFSMFGGRDREVEQRAGGVAKRVLECKVEDIFGSVDALKRSEDYEIVLVTDDDGASGRIYQKKGK